MVDCTSSFRKMDERVHGCQGPTTSPPLRVESACQVVRLMELLMK